MSTEFNPTKLCLFFETIWTMCNVKRVIEIDHEEVLERELQRGMYCLLLLCASSRGNGKGNEGEMNEKGGAWGRTYGGEGGVRVGRRIILRFHFEVLKGYVRTDIDPGGVLFKGMLSAEDSGTVSVQNYLDDVVRTSPTRTIAKRISIESQDSSGGDLRLSILFWKKKLEGRNKRKKKNFLVQGPISRQYLMWQEERNDPDKATELHLIPDIRGSNYCLARAPRDKNGIKTLPPELIDVSNNLVQATRELAQGSNESKTGVDPLILVLGPEHGGRTRGVGCDIGYKKGIEGYVRKKRTYEQRKDIEEIRNEVRQQMKEELKSSDFWEEMRAELKAELRNEMQPEQNLFSPREDDVPNSVHMKSSLNSTTIMVRNETQAQQNESFSPRQEGNHNSVHMRSNSSTKSIGRKEQQAGEKVVCSTATVYPIGDGILHFKKLLKGHIKVSVIQVVKIHKSMDLPVPDDEIPNLESAVKGFIQWPIASIARFMGMSKTPVSRVPNKRVMPQHENAPSTKKGKGNETPNEPNKQDKALEETTKHQKMMQKIDEVRERWPPEDGYNKWMSRGDYAEPYAIRVNKEVFRQADESYFAINATDIIELLTNKELEIVPWSNESPFEKKELNAIIGAWFTLWRD
ncbi:hypothetical protein Tco_0441354 [Tanacetum coccineum]